MDNYEKTIRDSIKLCELVLSNTSNFEIDMINQAKIVKLDMQERLEEYIKSMGGVV